MSSRCSPIKKYFILECLLHLQVRSLWTAPESKCDELRDVVDLSFLTREEHGAHTSSPPPRTVQHNQPTTLEQPLARSLTPRPLLFVCFFTGDLHRAPFSTSLKGYSCLARRRNPESWTVKTCSSTNSSESVFESIDKTNFLTGVLHYY